MGFGWGEKAMADKATPRAWAQARELGQAQAQAEGERNTRWAEAEAQEEAEAHARVVN